MLGVPKDQYDLSKGWDELDLGSRDTPKSLGIGDTGVLAFAFVGDGYERDEDEELFKVDFSNIEELYPEEDE